MTVFFIYRKFPLFWQAELIQLVVGFPHVPTRSEMQTRKNSDSTGKRVCMTDWECGHFNKSTSKIVES